MPSFNPDSLPDLTGRIYIVTGATSGIGYHTAARLAQHGAHVYLCARTTTKGEAAVLGIRNMYPETTHLKLDVLLMDHTSLSAVVEAANHFLSRETALHGLVNNAGIMATPFAVTHDGFEEQLQVNYLAHWVFTRHLLPVLLRTAAALEKEQGKKGGVRIVNLTSISHRFAPDGGINFEDTTLGVGGTPMARYGQSKVANILGAKTLHAKYGPGGSYHAGESSGEIWTAAVHPGLVRSSLENRAQLPLLLKTGLSLAHMLGTVVDPDVGAGTPLFCVAGAEMTGEMSGKFFQGGVTPGGWETAAAKDMVLAERLEEWTEREMRKGGCIE